MAVPRSGEQPELFELESHYARKARRTRLYFAVALIAAIAITAVVAVLVTRGSNTTATGPPAHIRGNGTTTSITPTASAAPASRSAGPPPSPGSDADMTTMAFDGFTLPVSRSSGPRNVQGGLASGFAETPLGAALAAVHIGYRLDPAAGAAVYVPTAQNQTVGDSAGLISQIRDTPVAPKRATPSEYVGYRIADYSVNEAVTVHLEAVQPGTSDGRDVPINVEWLKGDWKIVLPLPTTVGPLSDPSTYTRF